MNNEILNQFKHSCDIFADVIANDAEYSDAVRNHTTVKENLKPLLEQGEEFRYIAGYPNYVITSFGKVINIKSLRILKPKKVDASGAKRNSYNYYRYAVSLCTHGVYKDFYVHRLVAEAFLNKPNKDDLVINHINHNTLDNRAINLEYITRSENSKDQITNRWTDYSIDELVALRDKTIYGSKEYHQLNSTIYYRRKKIKDGTQSN